MTIFEIGLVVTGKGEESFLPSLFRPLMARAHCVFRVLRRIGQRDPVTGKKRLIRMVGSGQRIPSKDEEEIGVPILVYLRRNPNCCAMVVDDLEGSRRGVADAVFARYRAALDEVLGPSGLGGRAAVHFLVNMLEAYYFADSNAVNAVASAPVIAADHPTDVEAIGHAKGDLKALWPAFDEVDHGGLICRRIDLDHVLSRPAECCWLRAMIAWCVGRLSAAGVVHAPALSAAFCLTGGCQSPTTSGQ